MANQNFNKVYETISNSIASLHGYLHLTFRTIFAAAYALLQISENQNSNLESIDTFIKTIKISEERALFLKTAIGEYWSEVRKLQYDIKAELLKDFIINFDLIDFGNKYNESSTPSSVSKLAASILGIKKGDKVIDYCSGIGNFIKESYSLAPEVNYYGVEIDNYRTEIAKIRLETIGVNHNILLGNVLNLNNIAPQYDLVFANYPFCLKAKDYLRESFLLSTLVKNIPAFDKITSLDWYYNFIAFKSTKRKAICIIPDVDTYNPSEKEIRKYFLEQGALEAVISLPSKLFNSTSISTTMLVLSHGNKKVMMVNAKDLCVKGRRSNTITDPNIKEILNCLIHESKQSKIISNSEIAENDYIINPERYILSDEIKKLEKAISFESVIKNVTRGAQIKADELDKLMSNEPTNIQYLSLANIQNGFIDSDLPYLTQLDKRLEKYCIKNHSLIISKNGSPFKIAVAEVEKDQKILGKGNIFIIEIDENKANPYFIKAFLESEIGIATLKSITVGTTLPMIALDQLKKIDIPDETIENQQSFANKYLAIVDEIKLFRFKINKAQNKLNNFFDDYQGE